MGRVVGVCVSVGMVIVVSVCVVVVGGSMEIFG